MTPVKGLQRIRDRCGSEHIEALLRTWLAILPNPFTPEDEDAGYRPVSGRMCFSTKPAPGSTLRS
ncbi:MAG: hypothetical protein ACRDRU_27160 [Pseudonocardiaceae bacterium]